MHTGLQRMLLGALGAVLVGGGLGCGGETTGPAPIAPEQAYFALRLNEHAVMLALTPPYNTVQLSATPLNAVGAPLTGTGTVTYTALDSTVSVSPTGLVTVNYVTTPGRMTEVVASMQYQGVTMRDVVGIVVTPAPVTITTYSVQPATGDSAKRALDVVDENTGRTGYVQWPMQLACANGTSVCPVIPRWYTASDGKVIDVANVPDVQDNRPELDGSTTAGITLKNVGVSEITVRTLAYGQPYVDSLAWTVGYRVDPLLIGVTLVAVLGVLTVVFGGAPKKLLVGIGAVVTFCTPQGTLKPVDVVFDGPAQPDSSYICPVGDNEIPTTADSGAITALGGVVAVDTNGDTVPVNFSNYRKYGVGFSGLLPEIACRHFRVPGIYHYHSSLFPSDTFDIEVRRDPQP